jgi:hypothetical protein
VLDRTRGPGEADIAAVAAPDGTSVFFCGPDAGWVADFAPEQPVPDGPLRVLIFLAAVAMSGIVYSAFNGVQPAFYGEMFPTKVRLSGMAIGTQIGYAIGGFAPTWPRPSTAAAGCRWRCSRSPGA